MERCQLGLPCLVGNVSGTPKERKQVYVQMMKQKYIKSAEILHMEAMLKEQWIDDRNDGV